TRSAHPCLRLHPPSSPPRRSSDLDAPPIMRTIDADGLRQAANTRPGVYSAPTLEALAETAGIDPCGLADTLEEYNAAVESGIDRSEEHTSELQSREKLVCRLLLEK